MNTLRYYLALLLLLGAPPAVVFWLLVHPFIAVWRRLGPAWSYPVLWAACLLTMLALYGENDSLLAIEFGTQPVTVGLGATCLVVAAYLRWKLAQHIATYQLLGLPELDPARYPAHLVTTGLHALVRHPRYSQFLLAFLGYALVANYLTPYLLLLLWIPSIYGVAVLEERELLARYGDKYAKYCIQVPRFVPRVAALGEARTDSKTNPRGR